MADPFQPSEPAYARMLLVISRDPRIKIGRALNGRCFAPDRWSCPTGFQPTHLRHREITASIGPGLKKDVPSVDDDDATGKGRRTRQMLKPVPATKRPVAGTSVVDDFSCLSRANGDQAFVVQRAQVADQAGAVVHALDVPPASCGKAQQQLFVLC